MNKDRPDSNSSRANARAILDSLSREDRRALLGELLLKKKLGDSHAAWPYKKDLLDAENWFRRTATVASNPRQKHSRLRMFLTFLLLRYGALKITEIFELDARAFDLDSGVIHLRGGRGRRVPVPMSVARQMRHLLNSWGARFTSRPLRCDPSHIRRCLRQCAVELGLEAELLNARSLRRLRAIELEAANMPRELVRIFLGLAPAGGIFRPEEAEELIKSQIQEEEKMKTSARNFFAGKIIILNQRGILVEVVLETPEGLKVAAIITETSRKSLNLRLDMPINAIIKAPWVTVLPAAGALEGGNGENCFQGVVEEIRSDELASEILVALPQGNLLCSLRVAGAGPAADMAKGDQTLVCFSPFSVILTL